MIGPPCDQSVEYSGGLAEYVVGVVGQTKYGPVKKYSYFAPSALATAQSSAAPVSSLVLILAMNFVYCEHVKGNVQSV